MFSAILGILVAIAVAALLVALYFAWVTRRIARAAERSVPRTGSEVDIGGGTIRYVEQGEGRPILFIHGLGAQLHQFTHSLFPAIGEGYRLIAIDRPGSGYATRTTAGARITEQADQIARFIDALGLDRPLVVGHSLGAAISLALALRHPGKVAGLALISPLTNHVPRPPAAFGGLYIASPFRRRLISATLAIPMARKQAAATLAFLFGPQHPPEDYLTRGGGNLGLRPSHFHATSTDLVAVERDLPAQQLRYGELAMPVGILHGDADIVLDCTEQGRWMVGRTPDIEVEILPGVGHMPHMTEAERVAAFVRRIAERAFAR